MIFHPHKYRLAFFGTPEFAVPTLEALVEAGYDLCAVYTNPDRPQGRSHTPVPSPIKATARKLGIPEKNIRQPARFSRAVEQENEYLTQLKPDLAIVVAYGHIFPATTLMIPRLGFLNIHASLLPRWRGAAPIQAALASGDTKAGVTLMQLDETLDTGPIYAQQEITLTGQETSPELFKELATLGAQLLLAKLPDILTGKLKPTAQPQTEVTYAPLLNKQSGLINWTESARNIERKFRAYQPWPGLYTFYQDKRLVVEALHAPTSESGHQTLKPGEVAATTDQQTLTVGTAEGQINITRVKPAGKKSMTVAEFLRGHPEIIGTFL